MDGFDLPAEFSPDPPRLFGSRDKMLGQTYFPPRPLSVDGALRPLATVELSREGELYSFATLGATTYGQIDLPEQVRVLAVLAAGDYAIGDRCRLEAVDDNDAKPQWRFARA